MNAAPHELQDRAMYVQDRQMPTSFEDHIVSIRHNYVPHSLRQVGYLV